VKKNVLLCEILCRWNFGLVHDIKHITCQIINMDYFVSKTCLITIKNKTKKNWKHTFEKKKIK
jgi:hypothetical protein